MNFDRRGFLGSLISGIFASWCGSAVSVPPGEISLSELELRDGCLLDFDRVKRLAIDIRTRGIEVPVLVTKRDARGYREVIGGNHRVMACRMLHRVSIPYVEYKAVKEQHNARRTTRS